ncbi:MAG: hypothetical protein ACOC3Z_03065 [Nanoarchaeota archaeon]
MKVKELIKWLQEKNPEDFVGILDYGFGNGDWEDLQVNKDFGLSPNFKILSYKEAIKKMKKDYSHSALINFLERYSPNNKNSKDSKFELSFIMEKTSKRECLLCDKNLDRDIGKGRWHIPLCKKHRKERFHNTIKLSDE